MTLVVALPQRDGRQRLAVLNRPRGDRGFQLREGQRHRRREVLVGVLRQRGLRRSRVERDGVLCRRCAWVMEAFAICCW